MWRHFVNRRWYSVGLPPKEVTLTALKLWKDPALQLLALEKFSLRSRGLRKEVPVTPFYVVQ